MLRLRTVPEGIAELVRLGLPPRRDRYDPATVAGAIIDLTDAAPVARLRPG